MFFWLMRFDQSVAAAGSLGAWIDRLLGLRQISWSQEGVVLGWRHALPAWVWVAIAGAAVGVSVWSYGRQWGPVRGRMALATLRATLIVLIAAVLAGPTLVLNREDVEPDSLLLLVDRSASMRLEDAVVDSEAGPQPVSRAHAVQHWLTQQADLFSAQRLGRDRRLIWMGFDDQAYAIDPPYTHPDAGDRPRGDTTALRTAIDQALDRAAGRPISGVVLFTDGRSPQSTGADLVRRLQQQAVSVFPVPMGAQRPQLDLSLAQVDAPQHAFVNDTVPVTVWVDHYPADAEVDPAHVRVRLTDAQTGQTLDEATPGPEGLSEPLRLIGQSAVAGPATWRVELEYTPPGGSPDGLLTPNKELITENNRSQVSVELIDRPIRVLYVEGYPRWEYRYLASVLVREQSISSSVLLVSADRHFVQEGDTPITRLPADAKELEPFDVVVIGDVPADYMSLDQQSLLRDHVAVGGAGLLWIGGAYHTPYTYTTTPLGELLPMARPGLTESLDPSIGPVDLQPTPLAEAINVLSFYDSEQPEDSGPRAKPGWPTGLPGLLWAQAVGTLKPTAEVLATGSYQSQESPVPLVMRMRYGNGQVVYVATDDTWRWRFGRGDLYYQQFWVQLVRMLGRQRVQDTPNQARLRVSHPRVELGQAVVVELHLNDPLLADRQLLRVAVGVTTADEHDPTGSGPTHVEQIELVQRQRPDAPLSDQDTPSKQLYQAVWHPRHTGRLLLRVNEPALSHLDTTAPIEVIHPADELRQPLPDHPRLAALAQQTGGQVVEPDQLDKLATLIPNRARRTPNDIREPLWDTPLTLLAVLVLLTAEWVGRKVIRLV